jgi:hypothetical protein
MFELLKKTCSVLILLLLYSCGNGSEERNFDDKKDRELQEYNLEIEKAQASFRTPCDTISIKEYIIESYPAGTYVVNFAPATTFSVPKPAVVYFNSDSNYIFAVIAKSKEGERLIETKNIVGYESSFITLDSTRLGTAFFFLSLFVCNEAGEFDLLWEAETPMHGGFNSIKLKYWLPSSKNIMYVELNFHDGIISGNRNYNYFLVNGIRSEPHLLETYDGLTMLRRMENFNDDDYPDYLEYRFTEISGALTKTDSIKFYWDKDKSLYITDRNRRWRKKY